ncbi:GlxA family transcriptional regulator [Actinomadura rudentiformis]|uniref:Helix-turn-helix domain-containing protein n=1 Tax=Actinomadura rudentiformis TaxID=359158 RepID=A0A6H9YES8_9ACTN|nr:helix-turn-helix domain-containing protein [Actinomadura rudentiformis]KAB2343801.1 helix-turn-helix domain-containing protein [Actinomadura rudentiformis]
MGFRSIVAYAPESLSTLGLGLAVKIFSDRYQLGVSCFDFAVATDTPGPVVTDLGLIQHVEHGLDRLAQADLILLIPGEDYPVPTPAATAALRAAHERGAIIAAYCSGSYLLAGTGLLDGLRATTHWRMASALAARFPRVRTVPDALYVDEGQIVTCAGAAAALDMFLHLVRREHGSSVANMIARDTVASPQRFGGQAQYVSSPVPEDERIPAVLAWAWENLRQPLSVNELAARAHMSPRTFARRFKTATGTTPHAWLLNQRLNRVEELLETTDLSIQEIANETGYRNTTVLREQFIKRRGMPPRVYRSSFHRTCTAGTEAIR